MYLITVEGPDGSGKGVASRIVCDTIRTEFTATGSWLTAEPRKHTPLGKMAIESVRDEGVSPIEQATLFAADRLHHSHVEIRPRLERGEVVVSDRNVISSIVYQGLVGDLGPEVVARLNSGALRPDLTIFLDAPIKTTRSRMSKSTLRSYIDEGEYFERGEWPEKVREAYLELGAKGPPSPFDTGVITEPLMNDGSLDGLKKKVMNAVRTFLHTRRRPLNVDENLVDMHLLHALVERRRGQKALPGLSKKDIFGSWADGIDARAMILDADRVWKEHATGKKGVPRSILNASVGSLLGTLSVLGPSDVTALRRNLGPVRFLTIRHLQRLIRTLMEVEWVTRRSVLRSQRDLGIVEIHPSKKELGFLLLGLQPILNSMGRKKAAQLEDLTWTDYLAQAFEKESLEIVKERMQILGGTLDL